MQQHGRADVCFGEKIKQDHQRERGKKDNVLLFQIMHPLLLIIVCHIFIIYVLCKLVLLPVLSKRIRGTLVYSRHLSTVIAEAVNSKWEQEKTCSVLHPLLVTIPYSLSFDFLTLLPLSLDPDMLTP
jgi:hypothetical protein